MAGRSCKIHPATEDNFEKFSLCWLDATVNTSIENQDAQKQLRAIINHLKIFDNQLQCQQFIESLSEQDRLILIVSGQLGRQIVPQTHHLRQLSSIYVYCMDKQANEEWARHYKKIREVIVELDDLIAQIKSDQKIRVKIEEPILFNIYSLTGNHVQSTIELNKNFTHSVILINALLRLESNSKDKQQLITFCKKEYKGDKNQLDMIDEFNDKYTAAKAIWLYTRESFLYRMLNKALHVPLRIENIDLLLSFRFVISNIYEQLKENQYKLPICVYCGHMKQYCETEYLKNSVNQYLSINSFLLTSTNRNKALDFLNNADKSDNKYPILFIIDADPNVLPTKPFADISKFSSFIDEGEILFMIGCIFRIIEVKKEGQILTVRMELCGDNEHNLEHLYESVNRIHEDTKIDHRAFGDILHQMGKYDLAERIYRRLLDESPSNDPSISNLHCELGEVTKNKGDFDSSLKHYEKSLKIQKLTNPADFMTIGRLYGCIGEVHLRKENDKEAFKYFEKAIGLYQKENVEDHRYMADFYNNIASIYKRQMKYNKALEYYEKALIIDAKHSSSDRLSVAKSHNNIGIIYSLLNQHDRAMECYQLSLSIKLKTLSPQHLSVAKSYGNIGRAYKMKDDLQQALTYYQKAAAIYHHLSPAQHPDVSQTDNEIQNILRGQNNLL